MRSFATQEELIELVRDADELIARGLGRCYGDSALGSTVISTLRFKRILAFDDTTGQITCEAGVSLEELLEVFVPRGWFLPVTPGTKFVTVGGAIASDVHGKNHHLGGSISNHILSMDVLLSNGSVETCSKEQNPELFWSTCGGMGLTGIILRATFKMIRIESSFIRQEMVKARNIDEIMEIFEQSEEYTYSVAWIDCLSSGDRLGRSIMMRGEFANRDDLVATRKYQTPLQMPNKMKLNVPINFPNFVLNTYTVRGFNFLYYNKAPKGLSQSIVDYDTFFYPLDSINNWNRIYGKRGFTQYQCVLPKEASTEGMKSILRKISLSGQGSFLAVLKLFGEQNDLISFPKRGYTLALDFAITPRVFELLDELDSVVLDCGGRLYLTKDVRMSPKMFHEGYPHAEQFIANKKQFDALKKFQSLQSKRLHI
ncbi:FAD-binding protein [bacterium]|nr:FAD-binding protein [bacterium]